MSARIEQIIDVLDEVFKLWHGSSRNADVSRLRKDATRATADRLGVQFGTISDKYLRQLKPDVDDTDAFDALLNAYLSGQGTRLKEALMLHTVTDADRIEIGRFFERWRSNHGQ